MKIVALCNNLNQLTFFSRASRVLSHDGHTIFFWTNRLSVYLKARLKGYPCVLLRGYKREKFDSSKHSLVNPNDTEDLLFTPSKALITSQRLYYVIRGLFLNFKPDCIWFWNGTNQLSEPIRLLAQQCNLNCLFFEIGNFPQKLFVDPKGVNYRSWYAQNRSKFHHTDVDMDDFNKWVEDYLQSKSVTHHVPQSRMVERFNVNYLFDLFGFYLLGAITFEKTKPFWRTIDFLKRKFIKIPFDHFDVIENNNKFIFFPLQVSTDSQLLWNSKVNQYEALISAIKTAKDEGVQLVVKPHPAEPHWSVIKKILNLKNRYGFKLVNINPFILLKHCKHVITINSTVGLEGLLLKKPITILGHAIYSGFDFIDCAFYIQHYLINGSYFESAPFSTNEINSFLKRTELIDQSGR